jgi:hypothetical protein
VSWAWRIGSALALALGGPLAGPLCAQQPLTLEDYVLSLEEVQRLVEQERLVEAQTAARGLRDRVVTWDDETLTPDASALDAVLEARSAAEAARAARRLGRLAGALRQSPQAAAPAEAELDVLERITPVDPLKRGGVVASLRVKPLTLPERVEAALFAVADAISRLMRTLREWLDWLRPARAPRPSAPGSTAVAALAFALVVVVVLSVLVIRRRRLAAARPAGEPLRPHPSRRDEDPLSRGASEWERHAIELAAARRWREAIRAWYHAVLVSLFRHGLLHHQKGRTNWEYVARLEPGLAWRPEFMELTSLFDREWYGRRTSDAEALAECARAARSLLAALRGAGDPA